MILSMVYDDVNKYTHKQFTDAYLLDNTEAIIIIAMEYIGAHECEHRHDVVQNRLRSNNGEAGDE